MAQQSAADKQRMDRDLQVMSRVLNDLYLNSSGRALQNQFRNLYGGTSGVTGRYFPGHGAIFYLSNVSSGPRVTIDGNTIRTSSGTTAIQGQGSVRVTTESKEDFSAGLKLVTQDFFSNYADAMSLLTDDEYVSVHVVSRSLFSSALWMDTAFNPVTSSAPLRAEVKMGDIRALRSGNLTESAFQQKISYVETDPNSPHQKDLNVMRGILESALKSYDEDKFRLTGSIQSVMLNNFGAVFNLRGIPSVKLADPQLRGFRNRNIDVKGIAHIVNEQERTRLHMRDSTVFVIAPKGGTITVDGIEYTRDGLYATVGDSVMVLEVPEVDVNPAIDEYTAYIGELLLDYGRMLRALNDDERILIILDISHQNRWFNKEETPNRIEIEAKMRDLKNAGTSASDREKALQKIQIRKIYPSEK